MGDDGEVPAIALDVLHGFDLLARVHLVGGGAVQVVFDWKVVDGDSLAGGQETAGFLRGKRGEVSVDFPKMLELQTYHGARE